MFSALLITASIGVSVVSTDVLRPIRMTGHAVKKWSGYLLIVVGVWFVVLAVLPEPILAA